ncbi:MAG: hypothetical protein II289_00150 [Bacteroidales bacterium]|nr:hypothetical protein [Bacteroidales bacterium]
MQNLSKIDTAKDLVTKEWVEAQDFLPSSAFTKPGIKNALGISDWALAASKPSYDDVYLKLAGGTISGALLVNSTLTTSGSIYCNANIKINAGGKLILGNDEGITSWSDLKSKITYSFSEIGSKPTTLDGYGITDAVRTGSNFDATSQKPWILGYSNTAHGWKGAGPAMIWGTPGYYTRLNVFNENTDDPQLFISNVYANQEKGWAKIVTDKNIASYSIALDSNGKELLPTDSKAKASYVYGGNGWKTAGPAMIFPNGGYSGLFNFGMSNPQTNPNVSPSLFININYGGTLGPWTEVITDKNISNHSIANNSLRDWKPSDAGAKMGYVYGDNGWATNGAAMSFPKGNYTGLFNFTSRSGTANDLYIAANVGGTVSPWTKILTEGNIGTTSLPKINLNGRTISNWDQVRMMAYALLATTGSQTLYPNAHYTFMSALTSSSNLSITLTDDTSGESITKIYYIVFRTGSTTPTFTFNRTLYWKDGKSLTSLAANKRYRIVIDEDLATLETYS